MRPLRDWWSFLAMVFVGQCEVLVCLGFVDCFFSVFFPLATKLIGPKTGCQFFENVEIFDNHPLKGVVWCCQYFAEHRVIQMTFQGG